MYVSVAGIDPETAKWQFRAKVICQRITGQNSRRLIAACDATANRFNASKTGRVLFA
jgi:hypothetical protein